ncbi:hypothetical protein [Arthrobacter sp. Bi83]|nr:hypothetical protein [Arthrobacter sp. Bi83]
MLLIAFHPWVTPPPARSAGGEAAEAKFKEVSDAIARFVRS